MSNTGSRTGFLTAVIRFLRQERFSVTSKSTDEASASADLLCGCECGFSDSNGAYFIGGQVQLRLDRFSEVDTIDFEGDVGEKGEGKEEGGCCIEQESEYSLGPVALEKRPAAAYPSPSLSLYARVPGGATTTESEDRRLSSAAFVHSVDNNKSNRPPRNARSCVVKNRQTPFSASRTSRKTKAALCGGSVCLYACSVENMC